MSPQKLEEARKVMHRLLDEAKNRELSALDAPIVNVLEQITQGRFHVAPETSSYIERPRYITNPLSLGGLSLLFRDILPDHFLKHVRAKKEGRQRPTAYIQWYHLTEGKITDSLRIMNTGPSHLRKDGSPAVGRMSHGRDSIMWEIYE